MRLVSIAVLVFLLLPCGAMAASLEAYGQLPAIDDVVITPKGTRIAYLSTKNDVPVLQVMDLDGRHRITTIPVGVGKLRDLEWADERHLVVEVTITKAEPYRQSWRSEWPFLNVFDVETGKIASLPDQRKLSHQIGFRDVLNVAELAALRRIDGHGNVFARATYRDEDVLKPVLFRYDVESGSQVMVHLSPDDLTSADWVLDESGRVVGVSEFEPFTHRCTLRALVNGKMVVATEVDAPIEKSDYEGIGADGTTLIARIFENGDWASRPVSLANGRLGEALPLPGPLAAWRFDHWTNRLDGWVEAGDDVHTHFVDLQRERRWRAIQAAYGNAHVRLASSSDDFSRMVVQVEIPGTAFRYDFVDMAAHTTYIIDDVYKDIDPPQASTRVDYPARDGLSIPAYLTLPAGRPARGLPLVVLVHGGPASRDTGEFDWMSQALAHEGYAVLRPNYRGSDLGRAFLEAGFGQWGRKMQTDLSDGVRKLVSDGIVDPARVCIAGASYGGYAALAAITLDPGPWRCAVSIAGISDLPRLLEWVDATHNKFDDSTRNYWKRYFGAQDDSDPILKAISPARHISDTTPPLLLVHGEDDTVVPIRQSRLMETAMERAGRPVEFVKLEGEDHWLSRAPTRTRTLKAMADFLRRNNPADPAQQTEAQGR